MKIVEGTIEAFEKVKGRTFSGEIEAGMMSTFVNVDDGRKEGIMLNIWVKGSEPAPSDFCEMSISFFGNKIEATFQEITETFNIKIKY